MKLPSHFFDPELEQLYIQQLADSPIAWSDNSLELRDLFYQLNQPDPMPHIIARAYGFIKHKLKQVDLVYASEITQDYSVNKLTSLQVSDLPPLPRQLQTQENLSLWLRQTAAVLLTQPCWLEHICSSASSQSIISMQLMSLYMQLTGKNQQGIDIQQSYQGMFLSTGNKLPKLHSHSFSQRAELIPEVLGFATLQLALSRFPRVFLPEILGFSLAYCQLPTLIEICFPKPQTSGVFFQQRQQQLEKQIPLLLKCITSYLQLFPQQTPVLWQRILKGFYLHQLQVQYAGEQFKETLTASTDYQAVISILQQKAVAAVGHHQKIHLQGISLDKWFAGSPDNTQEFLQALVQSDYIDKKNIENSRLLKLFNFGGPMFGVLDKSEQDILLSWLKYELKTVPTSSKCGVGTVFSRENIGSPSRLKTAPTVAINKLPLKQKIRNVKLNNRDLYYYLLNIDLFPDVLPAAKSKVNKLLRACALLNPLPFRHYSHQQFDTYIENIYQREMAAYRPLQETPRISKEAYIWGFEQIAPLILIDGCWIQNSLALQQSTPEISDILFAIYGDEIGNGQLEQNHPYIFQQLLDSLSIHLPPTYSKAFSKHPGFINSAFDLPVYMLSLSSFSVEFLPELLGLNMAIELSGLGKSYMRLVDDWKYWGIDPRIASIHISIDNYASGHTFMAKKAIQLYMDGIMQTTSNIALLDSHWRRVFTGYASLRFVGGHFKFSLPLNYLIYKYTHKLGRGNFHSK